MKCRSFFLTCSLFIDSQNETRTTLEEEEKNFTVCIDNSCVLPTKGAVMEKPTDNGQVDACISSLNGPADVRCITPTHEETPRPAQRILANSSNLNTLSAGRQVKRIKLFADFEFCCQDDFKLNSVFGCLV